MMRLMGRRTSAKCLMQWCLMLGGITAIGLAGCQSTSDQGLMTITFSGVTPFDSISGVDLGVSLEELKTKRPRIAADAEAPVYSERIGASSVQYAFSEVNPIAAVLRVKPRLESVDAFLSAQTDKSVDVRFSEIITRITSNTGLQPQCFRHSDSTGPIAAVWAGKGHQVYVRVWGLPHAVQTVDNTVRDGRLVVGMTKLATQESQGFSEDCKRLSTRAEPIT